MAEESTLELAAEIYSPFDHAEVKRLRTYVEDVEALVASSFFHGPRLSVTIGEPGVGDTLAGPDDEATRAVAGLFRSLYTDHEPTSYNATLKLLSRHAHKHKSPRQREVIAELRSLRKLKTQALLSGGMTITSSGRELTPEVLIDVFLHGRYLHKDDEKMGTLEDFEGDVFLMFEFMGSLQRLSQVFWIGRNVVKPILGAPSLILAAERM
jgi:hypothetical protein